MRGVLAAFQMGSMQVLRKENPEKSKGAIHIFEDCLAFLSTLIPKLHACRRQQCHYVGVRCCNVARGTDEGSAGQVKLGSLVILLSPAQDLEHFVAFGFGLFRPIQVFPGFSSCRHWSMKLGYLEGPAMTCHNSVHRLYSKMTRKGQGLLHYIVLLANHCTCEFWILFACAPVPAKQTGGVCA